MKNYVSKFALFVALSCGFALAQSMPPQQSQQPSSTTPSASQPTTDQSTQPSQPTTDQSAQPSQQTPDQTQPSAQPDQSTMPKTDQNSKTDQDQNSKMPQSDTASAGSDVQSQVQTALQQDPKLANANINVMVKGNKLELSGTVPSGKEKKEAEKIAKTNAGNLKVKNHIKVASDKSMSSPQSGTNPPMDQSNPSGTNPSGQSNPPASKPPML